MKEGVGAHLAWIREGGPGETTFHRNLGLLKGATVQTQIPTGVDSSNCLHVEERESTLGLKRQAARCQPFFDMFNPGSWQPKLLGT